MLHPRATRQVSAIVRRLSHMVSAIRNTSINLQVDIFVRNWT